MTENPGNAWEQLKSELKVRFAEVNETMQVFAEMLSALALDTFALVDTLIVEV